MAGINPATGKFDPYYYGGGTPVSQLPQTVVNKNGTFSNIPNPTVPTPVASSTSSAAQASGGGSDGSSEYYAWLKSQQISDMAARQQEERQAASAWLTDLLKSYGMDSLARQVDGLVKQWGTNSTVIALKLKDTAEYKTRFKGLLDLQARGITDVRNESEYLALESSYRKVFREAGLTDFLGKAGTQGEFNSIADLVNKYSVSVDEVRERVSDAQRVAANTPQEVKDAFQQYYGVSASQLVAYALDPKRTADIINRQANAALAGGIAAANDMSVGRGVAEQVAGLAGEGDLNAGVLGQQLVDARAVRDSTSRLASLEGGTLTDDEVIQSSLNLDANAQKKVGTLQSRERARFGGSSSTTSSTLSRNGGI